MKFLRAGVYRLANGRRVWTKGPDGVDWRLAIAGRDSRWELFASNVARRLDLRRCVALGETGTLELPEQEWEPFRRELGVLAAHAAELRDRGPRPAGARRLDYSRAFAADVARTMAALDHAERHRVWGAFCPSPPTDAPSPGCLVKRRNSTFSAALPCTRARRFCRRRRRRERPALRWPNSRHRHRWRTAVERFAFRAPRDKLRECHEPSPSCALRFEHGRSREARCA